MVGITVVKQESLTRVDERGKPYDEIRVTFTVDDDGPFYKTFPKDTFAGAMAKLELEAFAREVRALRN